MVNFNLDLKGLKIGPNGVNINLDEALKEGAKFINGGLQFTLGVKSSEAARFESVLAKSGFTGFDKNTVDGIVTDAELRNIAEFTKSVPGVIRVEGRKVTVDKEALQALERMQPPAQQQQPAQAAPAPAAEAASAVPDSARIKQIEQEARDGSLGTSLKAKNKLRNICGKETDPDYGSQVCQNYRGPNKGGQER